MGISTHILDTAAGRPAADVAVTLERRIAPDGSGWTPIASGTTDADGRVKGLYTAPPEPGVYRVRFDVAAYFDRAGTPSFFPSVEIAFVVRDAAQHYHVPLLLSPFGYSTYRGS